MKNHEGLTALHQCCIDGSVDTVALLLKYGADVNVTDRDMWTPLHAAATCGHFKVVTMLVKAGANLTAVNGDGDMPHNITEEEVTLQYLKNEMMKRNISPDDLDQIRNKTHNLLLQDVEAVLANGGDLDQPVGQGGETFLHVAIAERYNDIVKLLLDNGASMTVQDGDGWQPLHVAAYWCNEEALEMLTEDLRVDLRAHTNDGETPYELCEDPDLKSELLHILKDQQKSSHSSLNSEGDDSLINMNDSHKEDTMDRSPPPTITEDNDSEDDNDRDDLLNLPLEDAPPSPLINIDIELHSERRSSIKGVKNNVPFKRHSIERSSSRERQAVAMEAIRPLLLQRRTSKENTAPLPPVHSLSPDSYRQFYEMVHPTPEAQEANIGLEVPHEATSDHTPQPPHPTAQTPEPAIETANGKPSPDTSTPENSEAITLRTATGNATANDNVKEGMGMEIRDGLMLRPRKKNAAPPPPRGSLQDLKRQRQEEREHRLLQGVSDTGESLPYSTSYQGNDRPYEAPPSPSMIRYRYKMAPDHGIKQTLFKQKKCIVM
ncbi:Protein phosphatase 1 regulatory inhibitor subunit 16B [Portunus trituberculatus]|uniref:Protein phosphatase 1 regulatory inhibitor subunit 16B n=1 Tax=Portunus trituberculatus TaxID=210409 RepID=A0A5B7GWV6_PORTR|nr:Protein phosphatase 1 regulatory inhibitor subunit 16B [Portunus trituberculatus]